MSSLKALQSMPEGRKKVILWLVVIVIALALFYLWIYNSQQRFKNFNSQELKEGFNPPSFEEELKNLPEIGFPDLNEEE